MGIITAETRLNAFDLGFDLSQPRPAGAAGFGLAIKCDTCGELCPTRPIAEGDRLICLGCAATGDADKAMRNIQKSISPQKLKKQLRKEKKKTKAAIADTTQIRLVNAGS